MKNDLLQNLFALQNLNPRTRQEYVRALFGYTGGKSRSLDQILPHIDSSYNTFVDGCAGSGIISLNTPDFKLKVFNDRHTGIIAFYRCIRDTDKLKLLIQRLELTLHSREEWCWAAESWENCQDDVERAARWYYVIKNSFSQQGRMFGRVTSCKSQHGKTLQNSLDLFPHIHEKMKHVQVENLDILQCIRDYDSRDTQFYIDPPYLIPDNTIYNHSVDHKELLDLIFSSHGRFLVSGYSTPLYESYDWAERYEWTVAVMAKTGVGDAKNFRNQAKEVLWIKEVK